MKNFFIIVVLSWSYFAFAEAPQCNINNYRDIVFQNNEEPPKCDLQEADFYNADLQGADLRNAILRGADLREADLRWADLREANLHRAKVTAEQAKILQAQDLTGFFISELQ